MEIIYSGSGDGIKLSYNSKTKELNIDFLLPDKLTANLALNKECAVGLVTEILRLLDE